MVFIVLMTFFISLMAALLAAVIAVVCKLSKLCDVLDQPVCVRGDINIVNKPLQVHKVDDFNKVNGFANNDKQS